MFKSTYYARNQVGIIYQGLQVATVRDDAGELLVCYSMHSHAHLSMTGGGRNVTQASPLLSRSELLYTALSGWSQARI